MLEAISRIFNQVDLSPHGICLLWRPELIWLHVVSDAVTGLAYYSIPLALMALVRLRRDLVFGWMFGLFAVFILACGTTHFFSIWTLWHPDYAAEGAIKAATATVSIVTAIMLWPLLPRAVALPSPKQLAIINAALRREIAERREIEARLHISETRYSSFFNNLAEGLFIIRVEPDGHLTMEALNRNFASVVGIDPAHGIGRPLGEVLPPKAAAEIERHYGTGMDASEPIEYEETVDLPAGMRTWHTILVPIRGADRGIVQLLGSVRDVTERKQSEERARQARDEAERANAAKSRFLAAASHDLRQPVQAAALFLGLLKRRDLDLPIRNLVGQLATAVGSVQGMLEGLLDLARLEAGIVAPNICDIALDDLLHRLAVEFNGPAQAAGLQLDMPRTSLVVLSDPLLLELILRNLLANAIKYTAHGGVTVECREMAGTVRIAVIDTGRGIPTDQLAAIFEEFWQLDNPARDRARGFGLGLAVVERAARLLGCHVEVHSEVGRGSLFALTVPLNPNRAAVSPAPARAENGVPEEHLAGRTILVVEDDPAIRLALEMLLQEWGLAVRAASSVEDAAALLEQLHQRPDVMLVDYRLPNGKCGTEAVALVHRRWPVPAILMTGDTAPERLADAMRSGCQLLHKPVDALKLRQALVDCL